MPSPTAASRTPHSKSSGLPYEHRYVCAPKACLSDLDAGAGPPVVLLHGKPRASAHSARVRRAAVIAVRAVVTVPAVATAFTIATAFSIATVLTIAITLATTVDRPLDAPAPAGFQSTIALADRPSAYAAQLPVASQPAVIAELGGRIRGLAADDGAVYAAIHSRIVTLDPALTTLGDLGSVTPAVGAPITGLAVRGRWLLAGGYHLRVYELRTDNARPSITRMPLLVADVPLRRLSRSVLWVGDEAWLPAGDLIQRFDMRKPRLPVPLPTWRPDAPSAQQVGATLRDVVPVADGALVLVSWNGADPNIAMLGEWMLLRPQANGEIELRSRGTFERCCANHAAAYGSRVVVAGNREGWILDFRDLASPRVKPFAPPEDLESAAAVAWGATGIGWSAGKYVRVLDPDDPSRSGPRIVVPADADAGANPQQLLALLAVDDRLLIASATRTWWLGARTRLVHGPDVGAWSAIEIALGDQTAWLRGTDGLLRWTPRTAPDEPHELAGEGPNEVIDVVADDEHVYVVSEGAIRQYTDVAQPPPNGDADAGRGLTFVATIAPPITGDPNVTRPRLWDADDGLLAVNVSDDQDLILQMDGKGGVAEVLVSLHGSGPSALALEDHRLHLLCFLPFGCGLATSDLRRESADRLTTLLSVAAGVMPAASIGHAGDRVALGIGRDLVVADVPVGAGAEARVLGTLDLLDPVLEIALADGEAGAGAAAWVVTAPTARSMGDRSLAWIDLSDPAHPVEAARGTLAADAAGLHANDGLAWIVSDGAVQVYAPRVGGRPPGEGRLLRIFLPLLEAATAP